MSKHTSSPPGENTWKTQISNSGEFVRKPTSFRAQIKRDGTTDFPPEIGRYHLYVSLACPWAHRTLILRKLKGLEDVIGVDVVDPFLDDQGWSFEQSVPGATGDRLGGRSRLREVYLAADPSYAGAVTVPVLWDRKSEVVVNNESSEIIRMQNREFDDFAERPELDLYPEPLRDEIDALNDWIYPEINNGVYRCGFAQKQEAYSRAVQILFAALDRVEAILERRRYLCGDLLTEADVRLFTTLVRFDCVYVSHFKCNIRRLVDYPNLWGYTRDIFQLPGVAETVNLDHIKRHYFMSHRQINPLGIIPDGPELDFWTPHGRGS